VFDLLDADGSNGISAIEFSICSYLFSCHGAAIRHIFEQFDVTGDDVIRRLLEWVLLCCQRSTAISA